MVSELVQTRDGKQVQLTLFTTLTQPVTDLVEIYGMRWLIETDLRTLKRTVNLNTLNSKTPEMAAKELLMGISAYNLVRALMSLSATSQGETARAMSFSLTLSVVRAIMPRLSAATSNKVRKTLLQKMLFLAGRAVLPKRKKTPRIVEIQGGKLSDIGLRPSRPHRAFTLLSARLLPLCACLYFR